jgi:hypothetical protein
VFVHGCNYPWSTDGQAVWYGLDFGSNVWGSHLGVSTRRDAVARDFARMAQLGFLVTRWFVFCDGRAGIAYDDRGFPAGPDPVLFLDLDAALEIAREHGMRLNLVLLDHHWMFSGLRDTLADPVTGTILDVTLPHGRSRVLLTDEGRDALVDSIIAPVVRRYGPSGERPDLAAQVFAWELMNEPDFVIDEWEQDLSARVKRPLPFAALAELITRLSDIIHADTTALATLGGARARNLWAWDDEALGLDVLQVHQYPDARRPDADDLFDMPSSALGLKRPIIIGEFAGYPLDSSLEAALSNGYAGAWPWSFSGTDGHGRFAADAAQAFGRRHPGLVNARFDPR